MSSASPRALNSLLTSTVGLLLALGATLGCGERGLEPSRVITQMPAEALAAVCSEHGELVGEIMDERWAAKEYPTTVHRTILLNMSVPADKVDALVADLKSTTQKLAEEHGARINPETEGAGSMQAVEGVAWKYETDDRHGVLKFGIERGHGELTFNPTYQGSLTISPQGENDLCLDLTIDEYQSQ